MFVQAWRDLVGLVCFLLATVGARYGQVLVVGKVTIKDILTWRILHAATVNIYFFFRFPCYNSNHYDYY